MTLSSDVAAAVAAAGFGPALAGRRVTVVVPDFTRPLPFEAVLPTLLAALEGAKVTVLVGLGLHRPLEPAERARLEALVAGARLVEHRADDPMALVTACANVGGLSEPLPAALSAHVVEAEARVLVGVVEPHQYAGFSGGAKGVAIGAAGRATISGLHGLELLRHPRTRIGVVEGNPFQAALWRITAGLDPTFAVQVVPSAPPQVFAGRLRPTFEAAARAAQRACFVDVEAPYPAVVTRVPAEKAKSFYQASRAITYLTEVEAPAIEDGGAIVLEAACPEGLGRGAGERSFAARLATPPDRLRKELAGELAPAQPPTGGAQRAYVLARALARHRVALVGAPAMPELERLGVVQAPDLDAATRALGLEVAPVRLTDVFRRLPRYRGGLACDS